MASVSMCPNSWIRGDRFGLSHSPYTFLLGDESFLILVLRVGLVVWTFDSNVQVASGVGEYTELRAGIRQNLQQDQCNISALKA